LAGSISVGQHPISTKIATLFLICYQPECQKWHKKFYHCNCVQINFFLNKYHVTFMAIPITFMAIPIQNEWPNTGSHLNSEIYASSVTL
jgi:hypothetical protein